MPVSMRRLCDKPIESIQKTTQNTSLKCCRMLADMSSNKNISVNVARRTLCQTFQGNHRSASTAGPRLSEIGLASVAFGPKHVVWPKSVQIWSCPGHCWSISGLLWPIAGQSNVANFGPIVAEFGLSLVDIGPISVDLVPMLIDVGGVRANIGRHLANGDWRRDVGRLAAVPLSRAAGGRFGRQR